MNSENLKILSNFTRKLVNFGYRVHPAKLVYSLKKGEFGYTVEEGSEEVATNDYVLASDFEALLEKLYTIFKSPKLFLKKENVIFRSEVATKVDNTTLKATYKDEKLWRQKRGEMTPEYMHSFVYEDNYAIYENRFLTYLIDQVYADVTKKVNSLILSVETLNSQMGGGKDARFTLGEYVDYVGDNLPTLTTDQDATVGIIKSLVNIKKKLNLLKNTNVYKDCKKEGDFNVKGLKPTNILLKDTNYHYCYAFYLNYLNTDPSLKNQQSMYVSFVTVNILGALVDMGFEIDEENDKIGLANTGVMRYSDITLRKPPFSVSLSKDGSSDIVLKVSLPDSNQSKYVFRVLNSDMVSTIQGYTTLADYVKTSASSDAIRTFVVNDVEKIDDFGALYVLPSTSASSLVIKRALKSCFMLARGSSFVHERYCPICGSNLVSREDEYISCESCESKYHVFEYEYVDYVWFKDMPRECEYDSAKEISPTLPSEMRDSEDIEPTPKKTTRKTKKKS